MPANNFKHGLRYTKIYRTWSHMKGRCFNPKDHKYPSYGGRGITMYEKWVHDVVAFYEYIGDPPSPNHSIDRIDNDGNYEPGNVRWATLKQQRENQRSGWIKRKRNKLGQFK